MDFLVNLKFLMRMSEATLLKKRQALFRSPLILFSQFPGLSAERTSDLLTKHSSSSPFHVALKVFLLPLVWWHITTTKTQRGMMPVKCHKRLNGFWLACSLYNEPNSCSSSCKDIPTALTKTSERKPIFLDLYNNAVLVRVSVCLSV